MTETTSAAKRPAKKKAASAGRPPLRAVTDDHKAAMAAGREESTNIRRYLDALAAVQASKRRGPTRSVESIQAKIDALAEQIADAEPLQKVALVQKRLDLQEELDRRGLVEVVNPEDYEEGFVKSVVPYSARRGLTRAAWREIGVPAAVLTKAGLPRS